MGEKVNKVLFFNRFMDRKRRILHVSSLGYVLDSLDKAGEFLYDAIEQLNMGDFALMGLVKSGLIEELGPMKLGEEIRNGKTLYHYGYKFRLSEEGKFALDIIRSRGGDIAVTEVGEEYSGVSTLLKELLKAQGIEASGVRFSLKLNETYLDLLTIVNSVRRFKEGFNEYKNNNNSETEYPELDQAKTAEEITASLVKARRINLPEEEIFKRYVDFTVRHTYSVFEAVKRGDKSLQTL